MTECSSSAAFAAHLKVLRALLGAALFACVATQGAENAASVTNVVGAKTTQPAPSAAAAGDISLDQALGLALQRNPELAALQNAVRASEAAISQAGVLPNPTLDLGAENLGNSRLRSDGDRVSSIALGQTIEMGGKRAARVKVAQRARDLAGWDYAAKRLEVTTRARQAFVDVLAAQQKLALASESMQLAQRFADAVAKRVQAGKVSPVEETKARLELSAAQIQSEQAKRELEAARNRLGAAWNERPPRFQRALGELDAPPALAPYEQFAQRLRENPNLARWGSEIDSRKALIDEQRAKAMPDLGVGVGASRFSHFNDNAYTLNLSVPLPVFDRNRGGILEANRRLDQALAERSAAINQISAELAQAYARGAGLRNEVQTLRDSVLPGAQSAFDAANKGYELGKFGFLDVLDAQRTLFQVRGQYLQALADEHRTRIEIERLTGGADKAAAAASKP